MCILTYIPVRVFMEYVYTMAEFHEFGKNNAIRENSNSEFMVLTWAGYSN